MKKTIILASALIATAAAAEPQPASEPAGDPNERICVTRTEIGSRLGGRRVCATRAQWAEERRSAQATTEHGQLNQLNPTQNNPGVRADAAGRYISPAARGGSPN